MIRLVLIAAFFLLLFLSTALWLVTLARWQEWAAMALPYLPAEKIAIYLSAERLRSMQVVALVLSVLMALAVWQHRRVAVVFRLVGQGFQQGGAGLIAAWRQLSPVQQKIIGVWLLLSAFFRLLLAWKMPVQLDEAFSYVFITRFGPLVTLSFYPGPNNHIGYLVWSACLNSLADPQWALRLPSLLCGPLVSVLLLLFFHRFVSFPFALAGMLLYEAEAFSVAYSVQGRGYWLVVLCTLWLAWLSSHMWERYQESTLAAWIVTAALGLWVMPVFLYPAAVLFLSLPLLGRMPPARLAMVPPLVGLGAALLYLPALLISGWKAVST